MTIVLACIDLDCIFLFNSRIFDLSFFSRQSLDIITQRRLEMGAGVSNLFENVPQLVVIF
eukprot:UN28188